MELKQQIQQDMKDALKAKNSDVLKTLRMLWAAIRQKEIDERIETTNPDILNIIQKMIKQRRDAASQFEQANRQDLVDNEKSEIEVLRQYLPQPLSPEEINQAIQTAISSHNASGMKDMGPVMATLKADLQGRADMAEVSKKVRGKLSA